MPKDSDAFVLVRTTLYPWEAQLLKSVLEAEGLPVSVQNEHLAHANWLYVGAAGGLRVLVRQKDLARAREVLDELGRGERELDPEEDA